MLINLIKTADKEDMKKWIIVLTLFLSGYFVFSQEVKPLYQLPENPSVNSSSEIESGTDVFLVFFELQTGIPLFRFGQKVELTRFCR